MKIVTVTQDELEDVLAQKLHENGDQKLNNTNALFHLKNTMGEWKKEQNWPSPRAYEWVAKDDDGTMLGGTFITVTSRPPVHVTFRHIFLFEEARGKGVAEKLYNFRYQKACEMGVKRVRVFANIPALPWHVKCGMRFLAMNKAKQPFTYLPLERFDTLREYGEWLDSIGPRAAMDLVEPQVTTQMEKIISKGGRWYTDEEFIEQWGSPLAPKEGSSLEAFL